MLILSGEDMDFVKNYSLDKIIAEEEGNQIELHKRGSMISPLPEFIIIKKYKLCKTLDFPTDFGCLYREYRIGITLNRLNHPNLIKTYAYFTDENYAYLAIEYAEGVHFSANNFNPVELKIITKTIVDIITDLQSKIFLTHYDLHQNNILIKRDQTNKDQNNNFTIKFIDYGASYCKGIDGWAETSAGSKVTGIVPSVFDDVYDYATIIETYRYNAKIENIELERLLFENGFIPYLKKDDLAIYDMGKYEVSKYIGREYYPNYAENVLSGFNPLYIPLVVTTSSGMSSPDEVNYELSVSALMRFGLTIKDRFYDKSIIDKYPTKNINDLRVLSGNNLYNMKKAQIRKRKSDFKQKLLSIIYHILV